MANAFNIPAPGRQRQVDLCEFEASLVYIATSRTARATREILSAALLPKKCRVSTGPLLQQPRATVPSQQSQWVMAEGVRPKRDTFAVPGRAQCLSVAREENQAF